MHSLRIRCLLKKKEIRSATPSLFFNNKLLTFGGGYSAVWSMWNTFWRSSCPALLPLWPQDVSLQLSNSLPDTAHHLPAKHKKWTVWFRLTVPRQCRLSRQTDCSPTGTDALGSTPQPGHHAYTSQPAAKGSGRKDKQHTTANQHLTGLKFPSLSAEQLTPQRGNDSQPNRDTVHWQRSTEKRLHIPSSNNLKLSLTV